jgi:hypothetical protein
LALRRELANALGGEADLTPQQRKLIDMAARASALLDHVNAWLFQQRRGGRSQHTLSPILLLLAGNGSRARRGCGRFCQQCLAQRAARLSIQNSEIADLPFRGRSLGSYLLDYCRNAIAHIKRKPGRARLNLDIREERRRFAISNWIVKAFAEHYIRTRLALTEYIYITDRSI